jgi:hypothetical protein
MAESLYYDAEIFICTNRLVLFQCWLASWLNLLATTEAHPFFFEHRNLLRKFFEDIY